MKGREIRSFDLDSISTEIWSQATRDSMVALLRGTPIHGPVPPRQMWVIPDEPPAGCSEDYAVLWRSLVDIIGHEIETFDDDLTAVMVAALLGDEQWRPGTGRHL